MESAFRCAARAESIMRSFVFVCNAPPIEREFLARTIVHRRADPVDVIVVPAYERDRAVGKYRPFVDALQWADDVFRVLPAVRRGRQSGGAGHNFNSGNRINAPRIKIAPE